jgi:hypothetical protein
MKAANAWDDLRMKLQERMIMSRNVLDEAGHEGVPCLVPIEEVLGWMAELEEVHE